ncbi:MBL fold metallo-hydrolase [Ensifer sp. LC13]|nr:MBL fold metallo-hydrolase [Ensifer sp. LC11]OCP06479.1 MBL fold metallo-hydrolase [Ensifer sp. LC13]OCP06795.1 MBL fold metallo-hydrolase [Ensifer sp. LC14]OCP31282.1 MBL fold metallo-hydrolase [Ensifer sp. LC499]
MPTVDARFPAEMAPGVFLLPDRRIPLVPNIGIIVGKESALVVDCGLDLESAENVLRLARELAPRRRLVLTVTHAHPEHGFGAQVFRNDARIYYNTAQRDHLLRSGKALLDCFRAGVLPPEQKHLLDGVELTPPHETYAGLQATIDLGGREVRLCNWGVAHSPGDQVVVLPQDRILFAGDLLEEGMFPIVPFFPPMIDAEDIDLARWEMALADIIRLQPRLIVPGHANLGGPELPEAVLGYFRTLRNLVAQSDRSADLRSAVHARYATWENPEFIAPALQYLRQGG